MDDFNSQTEPFEPRIAGFFCHTCCTGGDSTVELDRDQLPPNLKSLKFLCASMVETSHIYEAFASGVDGVLICGCLVGNCLNSNDNPDVLKSIHQTNRALNDLGIGPGRIRREWVCLPGGETYEGVLAEFVEYLRELGPLRTGMELSEKA